MKNFGIVRTAALVVFGMFGASAAFAQDAGGLAAVQAPALPPMPQIQVQTQVLNQTQAIGQNVIAGPVNTIAQGERSRAKTTIDASNDNFVQNRTPVLTVIGAPAVKGGLPVTVATQVQNVTTAQGVNQIGPVNTLALGERSSATTTIKADNDNKVKNDTSIKTIIGR